MDLSGNPALAFRFGQLKDTFDRFCEIQGTDHDRAFLLYLKFKTLAEMIAEDAKLATGHPTHFDEEAQRVMDWMEYSVGLNEAPGYCSDQSAAKYILGGAIKWG